jgi:hypothetical protein
MLNHRLAGRSYSLLLACLVGTYALNAAAATIPGMSQIGGWVYIDRNNDGHLAFLGEPNPEYVMGGVVLSLFSNTNNIESFVASTLSDAYGRYLFENVAPGTYNLKETQPVEYVDGKDTVGSFQGLNGFPAPVNPVVGTAGSDQFDNIVLTANVSADYYCFGERGLKSGYASKRMLLLTSQPGLNTGVPEPAAMLLAMLGTCGAWWCRRGRRS